MQGVSNSSLAMGEPSHDYIDRGMDNTPNGMDN